MATSRIDARKILRELVRIPSVHPEADPGGTAPGEAAIAAWVANHLRLLGADVRLQDLAPGRPTVIGVFEPARPVHATVVLAPHLDTVGVRGMTVAPFELSERSGRLHARGSCDTKGPMAALLAAFGKWTRSSAARTNNVRWIFAATAGEEQGSLGAQALVKTGFKTDFAVALEPTELRVVHAAKGILRAWIEVPGRAAHGATPERGDNAVYRALPLIAALKDVLGPKLARQRHPILGGCSLNLGIVQGGGELNLVPSLCRLGLDIRVHPDFSGPDVLRLLRAAIKRHAPQARLVVHRQGPSFVTHRAEPWARRLRAVGRGWAKADWFCDANVFAGAGIPAVAFGPGNIAQAHTKDEYILGRELERGVDAFQRFLTSG